MTREEAIQYLEWLSVIRWPAVANEEQVEALQMAIEALRAQDAAGDTISRQAAIDLIESIETERLKGNVGLMYAPAIKGLRALPSAQPLVIHCTDCEDWLERQSILGFTISELPSAQTKHDEKVHQEQGESAEFGAKTGKTCTDAISRAAVVDMLDEIEAEVAEGYGFQYEKWRTWACELPSVQPDLTLESAINYLHSVGWMESHDKQMYEDGQRHAQPEIIRCRDCTAYQEGIDIDGKPFTRCNGSVRTYGQTLPDWYCADAERRTDE